MLESIDPNRVLEVLGRDASGTVYRAQHAERGRDVASITFDDVLSLSTWDRELELHAQTVARGRLRA